MVYLQMSQTKLHIFSRRSPRLLNFLQSMQSDFNSWQRRYKVKKKDISLALPFKAKVTVKNKSPAETAPSAFLLKYGGEAPGQQRCHSSECSTSFITVCPQVLLQMFPPSQLPAPRCVSLLIFMRVPGGLVFHHASTFE